jgi:hypothetical protein
LPECPETNADNEGRFILKTINLYGKTTKPLGELMYVTRNRPDCHIILNGKVPDFDGVMYVDETTTQWAWMISEEKKVRLTRLMNSHSQKDRYVAYCYEREKNQYGDFLSTSYNSAVCSKQLGPYEKEIEAVNAALAWMLLW